MRPSKGKIFYIVFWILRKNILYRLWDITLFLAQQNLAFCCYREDVSCENKRELPRTGTTDDQI